MIVEERNLGSYVAILTYNEESNIADCVASILNCGFSNVVVFDGGSNDGTIEISKKLPVELKVREGSSISERRGFALMQAIKGGFDNILFVDADQRLLDTATGEKLGKIFFSDKRIAGVQLNLVQPENTSDFNYWQKGFYSRHEMISGDFKFKTVIGTPCFFRIAIIKNFEYNQGKINGPSDDTFFCKQIVSAGFQLMSTDIHCTEIVRASLTSTARKAFWYGIGDAEYILNESNLRNRKNHIFHVVVRNPIIIPLKKWNNFFLFYVLFGFSRLTGFLYFYIFRPKKYLTKS